MRVIAIGDIHGCICTFSQLLKSFNLSKKDIIYLIGDYIDRGTYSKEVIDLILDYRLSGYQIHTLRGNHEELLLHSTKNGTDFKNWMHNGGAKTLASFKVESIDEIPEKYLRFFKRTKYYIQSDKYLFVHAGVNTNHSNPLMDYYSLLWIREHHVHERFLNGRLLVHGHTPLNIDQLLRQKFHHRINIDGGCVLKGFRGLGYLVGVDLVAKKFTVVDNCENN